MKLKSFRDADFWIFDLDNTLYPKIANLFAEIEKKMTTYVMNELNVDFKRANFLRDYYWKNYGTTLSGMMQEHKIDPIPYLYEVHDIPLDSLTVDPLLVKEINKLNGEKIVYTNGSKFHANRVLNARGLTDCFHQIYGIEDANYVPKPEEGAYKQIIKLADVNPLSAVMFEDEPKNLEVPHKMGMQTVLITDEEIENSRHHITNNLTNFLLKLNELLNEN